MKKRAPNYHLLFLSIALLAFIAIKFPLISNASLDRNLIRAFDTDEYSAIITVEKSLNQNFRTDFYYYGNLYPLLTAVSLMPFKVTNTLDDQKIIIALRGLSLLFFVASVLLLFYFGQNFFGKTVGLIASVLLLLTTEANVYSTIAHADTLQIFLVIACLYYALMFVRYPQDTATSKASLLSKSATLKNYLFSKPQRYLFIAAFIAGLSFSTKYIGVFILPTLALASALRYNFRISFWRNVFLDSLVIGLVFFIGFFVTSPYHIIYFDQFLQAVKIATFWITKAFQYELSPNPFLWFPVFQQKSLLGPVLFYISSACLIYYAITLYNKAIRDELKQFKDQGILLLVFWIISFFIYLFIRIRLREARYLLPLVPFIYIIFAYAITELLVNVNKRFVGYKRVSLCGVMLAIIISTLFNLKGNFDRALYLHNDILSRMKSTSITAGLWLSENFSTDSSIYFDNYSYIPSSFKKITPSYGMFEQQKQQANPDVIVVNTSIYNRYDTIEKAEKYEEGAKRGMEIHNFYQNLFANKAEFVLARDFGDVQIFKKRN